MGVQLNIKSEEARALAEEISSLTGRSITSTVVEALRDLARIKRDAHLSFEKRAQDKERGFYDLIEGTRSMWNGSTMSLDHGDILYDDWGAPR